MSIKPSIYLDNQSSTPVDPAVYKAMHPYLTQHFANPHSAEHAMGWLAASTVEDARQNIADFVGSDANEVIFTSGATEANNLAVLGLVRGNKDKRKKRILVSSIEHKCVLEAAHASQRHLNYQLEIIPVDSNGFVDIQFLSDHMSDDVLLISVMAVNNEIGAIQDIAAVAELADKFGAIFHTDAAQASYAFGTSEVTHHADLVSLSGHKMYGPKGIGVLVVSHNVHDKLEPIIHGGGQQSNLRSGTIPTFLAVGMGCAASLVRNADRDRLNYFSRKLLSTLAQKLEVKLNGPPIGNSRLPGNLNLEIIGANASDLIMRLQPRVCISSGSACASGVIEPSHVLKAIGLDSQQLDSSIRIGIGKFNSEEEVVTAANEIAFFAQQSGLGEF